MTLQSPDGDKKVSSALHHIVKFSCEFIRKAYPFVWVLATVFTLCSCADDPNAGMVAARLTGESHCLSFIRHGKPDTAAMFRFDGYWYIYDHERGSQCTLTRATKPPPPWIHQWLDGVEGRATWIPVSAEPKDADLRNGCLPRAIAEARQKGGRVLIMPNGRPGEADAQRVP